VVSSTSKPALERPRNIALSTELVDAPDLNRPGMGAATARKVSKRWFI
jgi:hypothetical protein